MKTNIERLHRFWNDGNPLKHFARNNGKTTAQIHVLAGEIQVGSGTQIVGRINLARDIMWMWPKITEIFQEQGIKIIKSRKRSVLEAVVSFEGIEKKLFLVPLGCLRDFMRGRRSTAEVNLRDYDPKFARERHGLPSYYIKQTDWTEEQKRRAKIKPIFDKTMYL